MDKKNFFTKDFKRGIGLVDFKILGNAEDGIGRFEAYVSIFGNVDFANEIIEKGAFTESLKKKMPKVCWSHNWDEILGSVESAVEDEKGLKIVGTLVLAVQKANEAYELMKAGAVDEFSIGYGVDEAEWLEKDGMMIRVLKKLSLFEVSPVLVGCNPETELLDVKSKDNDDGTNKVNSIKEMTDFNNHVKILTDDGKEFIFTKNQIFDTYLAEKSGVKVDNNSKKKLIIIKSKMKERVNLDNFIYKELKDLKI